MFYRLRSPKLILPIIAAATALAAVPAAPPALAASQNDLRMIVGKPEMPNVVITVERWGNRPQAIRLELRQAGVPGSRLSLGIARQNLNIVILLDESQCAFDDRGSLCTVRFTRANRLFPALARAIRTGSMAHIVVENAGNIAMSHDMPLDDLAAMLKT